MGDFNSILGVEDRMHGNDVHENETRDFKETIEDCNLAELPTVGREYTWTNGHVFSRIDRAIVNDSWMINMPPQQVQIMNSMFSDHSPLGLELEVRRDNRKRPFKFYNCMADHPEFVKIVENSWTRKNERMEDVWRNLKSVKAALKLLNNEEFKNVKEKIKNTRKELNEIQDNMKNADPTNHLFEEEKKLLLQLEKWDKIEESIYKQKSRVQWLRLGDTNSASFFASMKGRKAQNQITKLTNSNGEILTEARRIEEEVTDFYKSLMGTAKENIPAIHPGWMRNGPLLNRNQQLQLIAPYTREEILEALKDIDDMKALGGMVSMNASLKKLGRSLEMTLWRQYWNSSRLGKCINL
ncbi:PREDICTED: uncharacterized protein LOC109219060 [Nicotiana attenuata]|uniref:uncharacterized protein LOC109219060 n=1 Tax=Nicotiana attenuata TaxID=49451 RepID=UPI000905753D|nr:PREDICTED: uncharacterized protein LOC109219060 [Nicotiana attenuata]